MNTETVLAEEQQRVEQLAKARRADALLNAVTNLRQVVAHSETRLEPLREQLKNFDALEKILGRIDGKIPGNNSFLCRDQLIIQSSAGKAWVVNRLAKDERDLATKREQLAAKEQELATFD